MNNIPNTRKVSPSANTSNFDQELKILTNLHKNGQNGQNQNQKYIIGISGASCSGKTTTARKLINFFKKYEQATKIFVEKISQDNYYKDFKTLPMNELTNFREFDEPECIDFEKLYKDILKFKGSNQDGNQDNKEGTQILLVEGNMITTNPKLLKLFNLTFFFDLSINSSISRRKVREDEDDDWIPEHPKVVELNVYPCYLKHREMTGENLRNLEEIQGEFLLIDGENSMEVNFSTVLSEICGFLAK